MSNWNYKCLNGLARKVCFFLSVQLAVICGKGWAIVGTWRRARNGEGGPNGIKSACKFTPLCSLLTPPQINQSNEYLWGLQTGGVGVALKVASKGRQISTSHRVGPVVNEMILWTLIQIITIQLILTRHYLLVDPFNSVVTDVNPFSAGRICISSESECSTTEILNRSWMD